MSYIKEQKACFIYNGLILNLFYLFISYIKLIGDTFNTHKQAGWSGGVHFLTVWQFWGFRLMAMAPTDCSRTIKWTSQAKWFLLILNCIETLLINLVKLQVKAQEKNILNVFLRWVPPPKFFYWLAMSFLNLLGNRYSTKCLFPSTALHVIAFSLSSNYCLFWPAPPPLPSSSYITFFSSCWRRSEGKYYRVSVEAWPSWACRHHIQDGGTKQQPWGYWMSAQGSLLLVKMPKMY